MIFCSFECPLPRVATWPTSQGREGIQTPPSRHVRRPSTGPARVKKVFFSRMDFLTGIDSATRARYVWTVRRRSRVCYLGSTWNKLYVCMCFESYMKMPTEAQCLFFFLLANLPFPRLSHETYTVSISSEMRLHSAHLLTPTKSNWAVNTH